MLLDKLWDDSFGGPHPERGLGKLRKITTRPSNVKGESSKFQRSLSMPSGSTTPTTPVTPTTPATARKENVWRSVFHPGSNLATKGIGAQMFDKPVHPNSPTVYDCDQTRARRREENVAVCLMSALK
ncbi:dormancy-associated protein 1-like isoform X2 [Mangifera indica]|uniref:dormancy-associated protein 1-like isoform X2 n=1 Tax=Mangifera indica TaxID=29780 RepID=UPI001CFAE49D|nr:dormancy-associated protein 1-like isoform X2 [Mangifera indica]